MILKSAVKAVRRQDWSTAFLELVIVVAGIFIGLQVDEWNAARNERERELSQLELVLDDLHENAEELSAVAKGHKERAQELRFAVSKFSADKLSAEDAERFKWALLQMMQYSPPILNTSGYDSMVASGDFAIIQDQALKSSLVRLHSFYSTLSQTVDTLTGRLTREYAFDEATWAEPHPSGRGVLWRVDFAKLKENRGALGIVANERRNHEIVSSMYEQAAEESQATAALVSAILSGEGQSSESVNAEQSR